MNADPSSPMPVDEVGISYEELLDRVVELVRFNDLTGLELLLSAHPSRREKLERMVPTLQSMNAIGGLLVSDLASSEDAALGPQSSLFREHAWGVLGDFRPQ